jgi:hypothetical protein
MNQYIVNPLYKGVGIGVILTFSIIGIVGVIRILRNIKDNE